MTTLAIGTTKAAFLHDLDDGTTSEPMFPGWGVSGLGRSGDQHLVGLTSNWMGMGLQRSTDLQMWDPVDKVPAHADPEREVTALWTFTQVGDVLWAGAQDASLFTSTDHGETWSPVTGYNDHPTRDQWYPGFGGMCAHRVLGDGQRMWVGASAIGVAHSDDGGQSWAFRDDGVDAAGHPADEPRPEVGYCVHNLAQDPDDLDRMWRQDHTGVYRTTDGAQSWERIEQGLPAGFGFVMWRDHGSGRLFTQPLAADAQRLPVDGAFRVYCSDDDGDSWQVSGTGWPTTPTHTQVLRGAVAGDGEGTVAMGTTAGTIWVTRDAGESWSHLDLMVPRITALDVW